LSHIPGIQEENDPKEKPTSESLHGQRNQPYIPLTPNIAIIVLTSTFVPTLQHSFRIPVQLPHIPFTI
jgi:hypothetical protein